MSRWQGLPIAMLVAFLAYMTRTSWLGCVGVSYTLDVWLHQRKALACEDMTLLYENPDKVVATCGNRREASMVRTGEPFTVCGRQFHATIERSYPEERYRLRLNVPAK